MPAYKAPIVGSQFHRGAKEALASLAEGDVVDLVLDPDNPYDSNAVRVHSKDGQMLGHVPMDLSRLTTDFVKHDMARPEGRVFLEKRAIKIAIDYDFASPGAKEMSN